MGSAPQTESQTVSGPPRVGRPPLYGGHPTGGTGAYARMLAAGGGVQPTALRLLTSVASLGFGAGVWIRSQLYDRNLPPCRSHAAEIPVVSVGNLSVGGTGKSLAAIALAEEVLSLGRRPAIVARGYGAVGGLGDEAQEQQARLGSGVPVFCNPDRRAGVAAAAAAGAEVVILDDGFQHRRLRRDVDLLCVDLLDPPRADHLLPLGLLREPLSAVRRAHGVLLTRADIAGEERAEHWRQRLRAVGFTGEILTAAHRPLSLIGLDPCQPRRSPGVLRDAQVLLVSGIGNPRGFEATMAALGANIVCHFAYPDHHRYGLREISDVQRKARAHPGALLVTTGKDAVKLAPLLGSEPWWFLEVGLVILECRTELRRLLAGVCTPDGTPTAPAS